MDKKKISSLDRTVKTVFSSRVYLLLRLILGGVFIFSGMVKITDIYEFAEIIYEYGLLPDSLIYPAAIALPIVEIIAGLGLVINMKYSLELITLMLLMFIGVLWFGIFKDLSIDCGCFSAEEIIGQGSLKKALYRDFVFMGISFFLFVSRRINNANRPVYLFSRR